MVRFEWNPVKARTNWRKHGRHLVLLEGWAVLLVAHTIREEGEDEMIRLISALPSYPGGTIPL